MLIQISKIKMKNFGIGFQQLYGTAWKVSHTTILITPPYCVEYPAAEGGLKSKEEITQNIFQLTGFSTTLGKK